MTPYGIVYRDNVASLNEGAEIWKRNSNMINKKYVVLSILLLSILIVAVNAFIFNFYEDKENYVMSSIFYTVLEIVSVSVLLFITMKKNVKNIFLSANSLKNMKLRQVVLRENDMVFSTSHSKANYFYDEIESIVEGIYSVNIIIEKGNLPINISKTDVAKGDIEKFIFILKEKTKEKYTVRNRQEGMKI